MGVSSKPRKKYRQKWAKVNTLELVSENNKALGKHGDYLLNWKVRNHSAMTDLLAGRATKAHMDVLIAMHNIVEAFVQMGIGCEFKECLVRGHVALYDVCARGSRAGRWICRAPEIQALNDLMELHDACMEVVTVKQMDDAVRLARTIIQNKRAKIINDQVVAA